jgi:archaellum biogenesis ATPase FlaH
VINLNEFISGSDTARPRSMAQRLVDAQNQPIIEPLLGPFWYSGELSILFADAGVGKSTLAVQIADRLSKGIQMFDLAGPTSPLKVHMLDFELSDRQVEARYKNPETDELYSFADGFTCDSIDFTQLMIENPSVQLDVAILNRIRRDILVTKAHVVIVDNISYLSMQTASDTQAALELMKSLVALKRELGTSILVLAHTPKIPQSRPITVNDLAGSKHLANFADSVFGLGRSVSGADVIYMKQVKASRSGEFVYDSDNVIVMRRGRISPSFLGFSLEGTDSEFKHLRERNPEESIQLRDRAIEMHQKGMSVREIAEKLLGDRRKASTVQYWIKGSKCNPGTGEP